MWGSDKSSLKIFAINCLDNQILEMRTKTGKAINNYNASDKVKSYIEWERAVVLSYTHIPSSMDDNLVFCRDKPLICEIFLRTGETSFERG